jgi:N-acetyl-gamma-glutamyl-phosphate reductase
MAIGVAVVGASGYTGAELCRLLLGHPEVELTGVYAQRAAGTALAEVLPSLAGVTDLEVEELDFDRLAAAARVAFTGLPHGASARAVGELVDRGVAVIDLSADFRLRDAALYAQWYGEHPRPDLLERAVTGLPELSRDGLAGASLIACPGCYVTASVLALGPLLRAGLIVRRGLIIDAKSGASGAGRAPGAGTHLPEVGEGIRAYKVAGDHRHTPEIEDLLGRAAGEPVSLTFTPHLIPISRGILACGYARATDRDKGEDAYRDALAEAYRDEPFVVALPPGRLPDTSHVRGSNRAHVAVRRDPRTGDILALAALDNLVKGAAGQAVQCLNQMMGWPETTGLEAAPLFP